MQIYRKLAHLCVLTCGLFIAIPSISQQTLGVIDGNISDDSGAVLGSATVVIVNNATAFTRSTQSSPTGSFAFQNLPIGTYLVTVTHDGFEKAQFPTIRVQEGHTTSLQVRLKVGQSTESITVSGSPLLNSV